MAEVEYEIKPKSDFSLGLKELWEFRELFYFFTWRDIKVKYKQALLGFLWALLQPLFMTVIFTVLLGHSIAGSTHLPVPYPVFALSGMLLWGIFSGGMTNASNSMVTNANVIKKIYFPRLIIPVSAVCVSVVDFIFALPVLVVALLFYHVPINVPGLLLIPIAIILAAIAAIGPGMLFASLNVKYRDVRYIIPFLVQAVLFLTPVIYPVSMATTGWMRFLLELNPMSGALELFRSMFTGYIADMHTVLVSTCSSVVFFLVGLMYFRRTEAYFADLA